MSAPATGRDGTNRLAGEMSPYLLQHASNPVDWYPWGDEAFAAAREADRPVFLSIGYATCHWCHVMERESFEDPEVARLMNGTFISVKVDREERPDLDHFYMTVCQALTGSGGWPLTIVMTPEKKPFFAGTYFPRESRFGRIGMLQLVPRLGQVWREKRGEVLRTSEEIVAALSRGAAEPGREGRRPPGGELLAEAFARIAAHYDWEHGGFGRAPKFPHPGYLSLCLRLWRRDGNEEALSMVERSLTAMRRGGVYDHVGFGFHRYSTDERWLLPHFEKMLYDQALISMVFTEAWQATGNVFFRRTAEEIFEYVLRDLRLEGGAFASAEDADSEGEEGKFYLWHLEEVERVLGPEEAGLVAGTFNLRRGGNFLGETGEPSTANIFHRLDNSPLALERERQVEEARQRLLGHRRGRIRPLRDDKVLVDWNGLMIAALSKAAAAFGSPRLAGAAETAARFLLDNLRSPDGGLLHRWREGEASIAAHLDDYAFLSWALLELYQATFRGEYLAEAIDIAGRMTELFGDDSGGSLYFTARGDEELPLRQRILEDGSVPSGNSVAALTLLRLARLTADPAFEERAAGLIGAAGPALAEHPEASCHMLGALDFAAGPSSEVVIVEGPEAGGAEAMLSALRREYLPNTVVHLLPAGGVAEELLRRAPFLGDFRSPGSDAAAYVCRQHRCSAPTSDAEEMLGLLGAKG